MEKNKRVGFQSALLVSTGVIAVFFAGSLLAWWAGLNAVAVLLLTVSVTGLSSRLWGEAALRRVTVTVRPEREVLSVGRSTTVSYTIENQKLLPLIWLELCLDLPPRDCLVPAEGFERRVFDPEEAEYIGREAALLRRFSFVMGWRRLEWSVRWDAVRRGVYRPETLSLRGGDGFGLTQSVAPRPAGPMLVVWPRIVPVRTDVFLRNVWTGTAGRSGWVEDPTVLRGERDYIPGDSWKRIDWRMAARTDELYVRQYDTVMPLQLLFALDLGSLSDPERAIELTASLIFALSRAGVRCGLALPGSAASAPTLLRPDDPAVTAERCLFALADLDESAAPFRFDETALERAGRGCRFWLVTEGEQSMTPLAGAAS